MQIKLLSPIYKLRSSYWFLPSVIVTVIVIVIASILLAFIMVQID